MFPTKTSNPQGLSATQSSTRGPISTLDAAAVPQLGDQQKEVGQLFKMDGRRDKRAAVASLALCRMDTSHTKHGSQVLCKNTPVVAVTSGRRLHDIRAGDHVEVHLQVLASARGI